MAIAILRGGALGAYNQDNASGGFNLGAGATKVAAVDPSPNVIHDDDASYLVVPLSYGPTKTQSFSILASSIPQLIQVVTSVTFKVRWKQVADGGGGNDQTVRVFARIGSTDGSPSSNFTTSVLGTYQTDSAIVARPGGGSWGPGDITTALELVVQMNSNPSFQECRVTSLWGELNYVPGGQGVEAFRRVVSHRLRLRRLPGRILMARLPTLVYVDYELLDLMTISHPDLPSIDGLGAGVKPWQRWPVVKIGSEIRWETGEEVVQLRDLRDALCTWWDVGKSLKMPGGIFAEGVPRLDAGNTRAWLRSSPAWIRTPNDTIVTLPYDSEKLDKDGELFESASTNEVLHSAFKLGSGTFTGWTNTGTGSNGSAIDQDTAELLFVSPETSGRSVKFTAGNPVALDLYVIMAAATASIAANTVCRASFWHKDDSGSALSYIVRRDVDNKHWRDSDQTWQVAATWNPMPVSTSRARHSSKQIDVGSTATTVTVVVGIPTTGSAGQVNHLYHVQLEQKKFPTSVIPTESAIVTRQADKLEIGNPTTAPAWPPDQGLWTCRLRPNWSAADVMAVNKTVVYVAHDANNYDWVYYDGPNARWVYERKASGTVYRAVADASPVAGTEYRLAARWTSSLGELDLANRTLSIFVNGVKSTDMTAAALAVQAGSKMEIGSKAGAENFDGNIWAMEVTQQALPDAAVARY